MPDPAAAAVIDPPAPPPAPAGIDPLAVFRQSRLDAGLDTPPADAPPADPPPPVGDGVTVPDGDKPPASKVPADILDPDAAVKPKVHDDVAELLAAELPKGAKKEQIESFGKLKTASAEKLQKALDRAAELETQIAKGNQSQAEIDALKEEATAARTKAAEIEEKWSKEAYASSPKFQAQFASREQTALDLAKSYLDGTEIKQDIIDLAAHATGRKRVELLKDAGIDDTVIQLISPHLATYDTVQREKQGALANWRAEATKAQQEHAQLSERAKAARIEQEDKVWDTVLSKIDLLPLRKSKDSPEWNARAEQLVAEAKRIFNGDGADLPSFAETILRGVTSRAQEEVVDHLKGEVTNLRAELAKLKSAAPGGSNTAGTHDGAQADTSKMGRMEVAKSTFNSELAKAKA